MDADVVVLATGHLPPDDPVARLWRGPRVRYVVDPWAELALTAIGSNESVCLLGTGLTAIDVLQTLTRSQRTAPVLAISRRGLLPESHSPTPLTALDPTSWLNFLMSAETPLTVAALLGEIRQSIDESRMQGTNWRQVIDELRPFLPTIWRALSRIERRRFMRHVRPFWEVVRHRMATAVADNSSLVNDGLLETDPLGLGVLSMDDGRAWAHGRAFEDLLLVGTLRKPDLWESTAVPELRLQAAHVAAAIGQMLCRPPDHLIAQHPAEFSPLQ